MNTDNGCTSYLDEIKEKGYLGFILVYLRTIMGKDLFAKHYSMLRDYLSHRFTETMDFDPMVDYALDDLPDEDALAITFYFGLVTHRSHSIRDTAIVMNRFANSHEFKMDDVGAHIGHGLRMMGEDLEFGRYIEEIAESCDAVPIPGCAPKEEGDDKCPQCCESCQEEEQEE